MFINTVTEGVSDFPMMIFPVATIKVIHSHEVMWLKCIGKFIGDFKIPVGANFIGVINDTYEIGTYWNFKITDKFSYTFEPHYFMRVNDFNSSNGKDHHWEITNTFRYRINEHWLPYFELRWLDRNVEPYHREQNQIRIGTKYFF